MLIREITDDDKKNEKISAAIDELTGRFGSDLILVLIEPENGEDLIIRPDIPQFSKNIVQQTKTPITKIASGNNKDNTKTFGYAHAIDGVTRGPFYDMEPPSYLTMTSGPMIASTSAEELAEIINVAATAAK